MRSVPALINDATVRTSTRPCCKAGTGTSPTNGRPVFLFCKTCFMPLGLCAPLRSRRLCGARVSANSYRRDASQNAEEAQRFSRRPKSLTFPFLQHFFNQITDPLCARVPCSRRDCGLTFTRERFVSFGQRFINQFQKLFTAPRDSQYIFHRLVFGQRRNHDRLSCRQILAHFDGRSITGKS